MTAERKSNKTAHKEIVGRFSPWCECDLRIAIGVVMKVSATREMMVLE
jgi:hypothetical protein